LTKDHSGELEIEIQLHQDEGASARDLKHLEIEFAFTKTSKEPLPVELLKKEHIEEMRAQNSVPLPL